MLTNTASRYGTVAKVFHWLTALLILVLIPTGIIANGMPYETSEELARKAQLFSVHKTLGIAVFVTALARIAWAISQPKPAPLHPENTVTEFLASMVHWLLYGSLVVVPLSGWVHHAATEGFAPILWPLGQNLPFVPESDRLAKVTASLHIISERVLVFSLLLHVAGALKHHLIDRDATLKRMWFGIVEAGEAAPALRSGAVTFSAALVVWGAAMGAGAAVGMFQHRESTATTVALGEVDSDWVVETGDLVIRVTQLGSNVEGRFADWTATIAFDEQTGTGDVDVIVAIPSLTLGSVTNEAMGSDYFAAETFPTARFVADIAPAETGYMARGELTIRDATVPIELPFALNIDNGLATVDGSIAVDRRDFGIGANMSDEGTLGFNVEIGVSLTARQDAGTS